MAVVAGDIIRATAKQTYFADDIQNVFHLKHVGAGSVADATVMNDISARLSTAYKEIEGLLDGNQYYTEVEFYNITQAYPMGSSAWIFPPTNTGTGDALPGQVAALLTFPTMVSKSLGKKFLGVFGETANEGDGVLTSAMLTALGGFAFEILQSLTIGGEVFKFGNYNVSADTFAEWLWGLAELLWSTQRRRKPGVGS